MQRTKTRTIYLYLQNPVGIVIMQGEKERKKKKKKKKKQHRTFRSPKSVALQAGVVYVLTKPQCNITFGHRSQ